MSQTSIQQALDRHRAGALAEAEQIYQRILQQNPRHASALQLLGALSHQTGNTPRALELIAKSIAINPDDPSAHNNYGLALRGAGKIDEAIASYRLALKLKPDFPEAENNLGAALRATGKVDEAIALYRKLLARQPNYVEALHNLSTALLEINQPQEAAECCRRAIALRPHYAPAHNNLGAALKIMGQIDPAIQSYRAALSYNPQLVETHHNLGIALHNRGQPKLAIESFRRAVALQPDHTEARHNLATALLAENQPDLAEPHARRAVALRPEFADAHITLGGTLLKLHKLPESLEHLNKALELSPNDATARANLAAALCDSGRFAEALQEAERSVRLKPEMIEGHQILGLMSLLYGDFARGWIESEARLKCKGGFTPRREAGKARWDGRDLAGKSITLQAEQGLGDVIQFVRYAPLVAARGGRVILDCQPELKSLLSSVPGVSEVRCWDDPIDLADFQCPLLSLPGIFRTDLGNIPPAPYLKADAEREKFWHEKIQADPRGTRVGLVWAGNPKHARDRERSIPLQQFAPLARSKNVVFYNLQLGPPSTQAAQPPPNMRLIDHTSQIKNFADTAALLTHLDLLITVDTSVAHLAGALGKSVWLLLPVVPDWRWLLDRSDSPWYPSMRIFRQTIMGNWDTVMAKIAAELSSRKGIPVV